MKIRVLYGSTEHEISIDASMTVLDLKQILVSYTGLPVASQKLVLQLPSHKVTLNNNLGLGQYSLSASTPLTLKQLPSSSQPVDFPIWVGRLVVSCQESDLNSFIQILKDYENSKSQSLQVEEIRNLLNTPYNGNWCCIHYASYSGHSRILQELMELSADCNAITADHWTPLQISCYQGHLECVKIIISHPQVNINKMTSERGTGLHLAASCGHTEIVRVLLENSANPRLEDPSGKTVLELAASTEISEIISKQIQQETIKNTPVDEAVERPLGFSGEVFYAASWLKNDKQVYIVLDTQHGNFNHYRTRDSYVDEETPEYSIPFTRIKEVKVLSENTVEKHFFFISGLDIRLKYYTHFLDMTEEWTRRILEAIGFFRTFIQTPKIQSVKPPDVNISEAGVHLHDFEIVEEIGSGSFGKVFKIKKNNSEEIYALKTLNQSTLRQRKQLKYAIAECKILKSIRHPFIIPLFWAFQSDTHLFMILEFCPLGDFSKLLSYIHHLNIPQAKFYISEIILAIEHLHSLDVIYRDLKPQNILLDAFGHIRLADFGLAKQNATQENPAMSFCGSPAYLPPEILTQSGLWKPADVYSIGANLFELLTGEPPFFSENINVLYQRITNETLKFPQNFNEEAMDLILKTMKRNPEERIKIAEIKQHEFFKDIDWDEMIKKKVQPPFSAKYLHDIKSPEKKIF